MITAKEALIQTTYVQLLRQIEYGINYAIKHGVYQSDIPIRNQTDNTVKDMLVEELERLGYTVKEVEHKSWSDVEPDYYSLYIYWKPEEDGNNETKT